MGTDWSRPTWTCPPELSLPTSMVWGLQVNPPRSCCLLPTVSVNFHLPAHGLSSFPSPSQSRSFPPMKSSPFQIHPWSIPANRALVAPPRAQRCLLVCFFTSPAAIDSSFFFFFFPEGGENDGQLSRAWGFTQPQVHVYLLTPRVGLSSHRGNASSCVLSPKRCLAACAPGQPWCAAAGIRSVVWKEPRGALSGPPTLTWQLLSSSGTASLSPLSPSHHHCVSLAGPDTGSAPQPSPAQANLLKILNFVHQSSQIKTPRPVPIVTVYKTTIRDISSHASISRSSSLLHSGLFNPVTSTLITSKRKGKKKSLERC